MTPRLELTFDGVMELLDPGRQSWIILRPLQSPSERESTPTGHHLERFVIAVSAGGGRPASG